MQLASFISENVTAIVFGCTTVLTSLLALYYARRQHQVGVEKTVSQGGSLSVFLSREAMLPALLDMYVSAGAGDTIWGQCVGCRAYSSDVRSVILEAASRGVKYKLISNGHAPTAGEFRSMYDALSTAQLVEGLDNSLRIQGLNEREVILGFPSLEGYTAIRVRDPHVASIFRGWFDERFACLNGDSATAAAASPT